MLAGAIITINYGVLYVLNIMLKFPIGISKIATELLLYAASYRVQSRRVFKEEVKSRTKMDAVAGRVK